MSFEVWLTDRDERYIVVKLRSTSRLLSNFIGAGKCFMDVVKLLSNTKNQGF